MLYINNIIYVIGLVLIFIAILIPIIFLEKRWIDNEDRLNNKPFIIWLPVFCFLMGLWFLIWSHFSPIYGKNPYSFRDAQLCIEQILKQKQQQGK